MGPLRRGNIMQKNSILPPDWKKEIREKVPSLPHPYDRKILMGLIEKQETEETAKAVWKWAGGIKSDSDVFTRIMLKLLFCLASRPSEGTYNMIARTRSQWLAIVRAMEVIQKDGVFFKPENPEETKRDWEFPFMDNAAGVIVRYTGEQPPAPHPHERHPLVPEGYNLHSLDAAVRWYRKRAALATHSRKRAYPEMLALINLLI